MEVLVKIGKANTVTNIWGKTKTKTDKDKKVENKRITVKFSKRLQCLKIRCLCVCVRACRFSQRFLALAALINMVNDEKCPLSLSFAHLDNLYKFFPTSKFKF